MRRIIILMLCGLTLGCLAAKPVNIVPPPPKDFVVWMRVFDTQSAPVPNLFVMLTEWGAEPIICDYEMQLNVKCTVPNDLFGAVADIVLIAPGFVPKFLTTPSLLPNMGDIQMQKLPYPTYDPAIRQHSLAQL